MSLHINQLAPNFVQKSTKGQINLYEYLSNSWGVLFSHPKDFTPVCTTELAEVAKLQNEWNKRNTKVIALSVDDLESHKKWLSDIEKYATFSVDYPIIADEDKSVSLAYDMLHPEADDTFTVRSVYFIDPNKKIRLILTYPAQVGRNFDEIIRILDALQTVDNEKVATPVNWKTGEPKIIPASIKDETLLKQQYGENIKQVYDYLRFTAK